ncbi:hypothetical protein BH24ACT5_BH24ACT5_12020 [soil metagenome]
MSVPDEAPVPIPPDSGPADEAAEPTGDDVTDTGDTGDDAAGGPGGDLDMDAAADTDTDAVDSDEEDAVSEELAAMIDGEIHQLAAERDSYRDIAQRLQADFENYRKRASTQMAAETERATAKLAEALLPVLDATEAAYLRHPDEVGPLLNVLLAELRKQGLESMELLDQPFDPNLAEAVAHEAGDSGEVVVAEVLRSGYRWNGRTLRPAMVRTRD